MLIKKQILLTPREKMHSLLYGLCDKPFSSGAYILISMAKTFIYVLTHPFFPEWVKIGRTTNPEQRLTQYQICCPFRLFKMDYIISIENPLYIESYFDNFVPNNNYEWCNINKDDAISIINSLIVNKDNGTLPVLPKRNLFKNKNKPSLCYQIDGVDYFSRVDFCKANNISAWTLSQLRKKHGWEFTYKGHCIKIRSINKNILK